MGIFKRVAKFADGVKISELPDKIAKRNEIIKNNKQLREAHLTELKEYGEKNGVDFGGYIPDVESLGLNAGKSNGYEPSYDMPSVFSYLNITDSDSLLDIGCGKGWAMHCFAEFPFKNIDGVELSEELFGIAKKNFDILYGENDRFHFFNEDALTFSRLDDYNYIYMYNPFPPEIVGEMAERLKESARRQKRKVTVIYQNPQKGSLIENDGTFKRIMYEDGTALYESAFSDE